MYTQIIPASEWFFVYNSVRETDSPTVWQLEAWGLKENGQVDGLIGAFGGEADNGASTDPVPAGHYEVSERLSSGAFAC